MLNNRGSTALDYIMITAAVVGAGIPVIMQFFGEPIRDSLFSKRQTLVSFLAQDRKQTVPSPWFSQDPIGDPGGNGDLTPPKDFADPGDLKDPGRLKGPGNLKTGNLKQSNKQLKVGRLNEPGKLSTGDLSGPGALSGGAAAGGGTDGGGSGLSKDFFARDEKGEVSGVVTPIGEKGGTYGKGGSGGVGGTSGEVEDDSGRGPKASHSKGGDDKAKDKEASTETRKSQIDAARTIEERIATQEHAFDWWLLIKFLVLLLIIFLLAVILLGNLKKR